LEAAIAARTFRNDLFYRLFPIEMPKALRERRDDIPLLVEYFIDRLAILRIRSRLELYP
jgi:transcriptional regulator with GAF, ATPase, and Fis domain